MLYEFILVVAVTQTGGAELVVFMAPPIDMSKCP